jgi:hypothetical protein
MKKKARMGAVAMAASLLLATPVMAEVAPTETFGGFNVVTPLSTIGTAWTYLGGSQYDVGITDNGINGNSIRISNQTMSGSFGDWLYSEPLIVPATETGNQTFTAEFDIASASFVEQEDLQISVAPQTAGGARMSFLRFNDTDGGIDVFFADVANNGTDFRTVKIADNQPRSGFHVKIVLDLYPGPHNDVAQVYINQGGPDGPPLVPASGGIQGFYAPVDNPDTVNKAKAGQTIPVKFTLNAEPATTWEDYYRFNPESNAGVPQDQWTTRQVDSLIFQARGADGSTNPNVGGPGTGFLIDNVTLSSTDTLALPTGVAGDPSLLGPNPFTAMTNECDSGDALDPIETYTPGASGLTYNATTGIWHYNWQTKNQYANKCVELTLNLTDDYALFKFVK